MERWRDAVALVTGASSGIGAALAERLVNEGLRVAALGRRADRLEALAVRSEGRVLPLVVDVRDDSALVEAFQRIQTRWERLDVLINNAGLGHQSSLIDGVPEQWREMIEVNVLALARCTQLAVQQMRSAGDRGHVIHLSSLSAYRVVGQGAFYGATKHAVRALTEGLRQELRALGSPIRVSSVSPGFVETEFHAGYFSSEAKARELYERGALQPADVADAVIGILAAREHAEIHDVLLRSTSQTT